MGKLTSSLGVLEPRYMLEIMKQLHRDFLGKVIENLGGRVAWLTLPYLAKFLRKLHNFKDPLILDDKGSNCKLVHFDSPSWHRVCHTHVVGVLVCQVSCVIVL